jgi:ribonuclease Y
LPRGKVSIVNIYLLSGLLVVAIAGGIGLGLLLHQKFTARRSRSTQERASKTIEEAEKRAAAIIKEAEIQAKDLLFKSRTEFEEEVKERRQEILNLERRLLQREENLEKRIDLFDQKESGFARREKAMVQQEKAVAEMENKYTAMIDQQRQLLERIAGISAEEAKERLMQMVESQMRHESGKLIKKIEEETQTQAEKKAREIIVSAIQRYAADYVAEETVSVVTLPNEEMKGRIIGREGRNIRALEAATGVDLIVDDTPEAVIISGFNPIRREVARITLE